jgi:hypothetical protein
MEKLIGEQVSFAEYFKNLRGLLNPIKEQFLSDIEGRLQKRGLRIVLYHWQRGLPRLRKTAFPVSVRSSVRSIQRENSPP